MTAFNLEYVSSKLGYNPCSSTVFRSKESTLDVEHFLYFSFYGAGGRYLCADFGFRNPKAEVVSVDAVRRLGGASYRSFKRDEKIDCAMRFSLGRLASWSPRWSLDTLNLAVAELEKEIECAVRSYISPIVGRLSTAADLLGELSKDCYASSWVYSNGAIRAAQIVVLGQFGGMNPQDILALLQPHKRDILNALDGMSLEVFLEQLGANYLN